MPSRFTTAENQVAMKLVAIDPGTNDLGVCLFDDGRFLAVQRLHAPQNWHLHRKMRTLLHQLGDTAGGYIGLTEEVTLAIEEPIYMEGNQFVQSTRYRTARPIDSLWMFYGALTYWGLEREYKVVGYKVPDIKLAIGGSRSASKDDVEWSVRARFPQVTGDHTSHEFDALAVAAYHLDQLQIAEASITGDPRG